MIRPTIIASLLAAFPPSLHADHHLGPVTDILVAGEEIYSCSQAGIFVGVGDKLKATIANPLLQIHGLAHLPAGGDHPSLHLFAGGEPGVEGALGVIEAKPPDGTTHSWFKVAEDLLYGVSVLPGEGFIAVAGADGSICTGSLEAFAGGSFSLRHKHTAAARAVAFSPDGQWLASAGLDGVIMISAATTGPEDAPRQLLDHTAGIECLVFSPDSKFIASGSIDSKVRLHEVSGKLIRTYTGLGMEHEPVAGRVPARVLSLVWHESALLAGTSKGTLYRLSRDDDTMTRLEREGDDPIFSLAIDPAGSVLIGCQSRLRKIAFTP